MFLRSISLFILLCGLAPTAAAQVEDKFTVVILGDSLTEGLGLEESEAFPSLLAARYALEGRDDIAIVNAGVSGSTSASGLSRLQWYARSQPDLLVLALGANDGLRGLDVDEMKANLEETIVFAQANGMQVALTGMLVPPNMGPEYTGAFAQVFPDLAQQYALPLLPFLLEGVAAMPELNQADGIHPNVAGAKIVADLLYDFLQPLLPPAS